MRPGIPEAGDVASGGKASSELEAVDTLKSEFGAVEPERGTLISLSGDVTIPFDKATIKAEARITLDRLYRSYCADDTSG